MHKTTSLSPRASLGLALILAAAFGWSLSAPLSLPYLAYSCGMGLLIPFVMIGTKLRTSEYEAVNPKRFAVGLVLVAIGLHTMFRDISTAMPELFLWQYRVQWISVVLLFQIGTSWPARFKRSFSPFLSTTIFLKSPALTAAE